MSLGPENQAITDSWRALAGLHQAVPSIMPYKVFLFSWFLIYALSTKLSYICSNKSKQNKNKLELTFHFVGSYLLPSF